MSQGERSTPCITGDICVRIDLATLPKLMAPDQTQALMDGIGKVIVANREPAENASGRGAADDVKGPLVKT